MSKRRRFGHERSNTRHPDKYNFGESFLIGYKPGEPWHARHRRRHKYALSQIERISQFCAYYDFVFEIKDDLQNQHHFYFYDKQLMMIYHWYPSSAKFVIEPKWSEGIHVHDHLQVFNLIMMVRKEANGGYPVWQRRK